MEHDHFLRGERASTVTPFFGERQFCILSRGGDVNLAIRQVPHGILREPYRPNLPRSAATYTR